MVLSTGILILIILEISIRIIPVLIIIFVSPDLGTLGANIVLFVMRLMIGTLYLKTFRTFLTFYF